MFSLLISSSCSFPDSCTLPSLLESHPKEIKLSIQPKTQEDPYISFWKSFPTLFSSLLYPALKITSSAVFNENWFLDYSTQKKTGFIWLGFFFRNLGPESTSKQKARVILKFTLLFSLIKDHMPTLPTVQCLEATTSLFPMSTSPPELFWFIVPYHP